MSTFDLICIGIGGTVGSGVFVLTGIIAREYAGPGVVLSWLIAGIGCSFSAMSYAELSTRIPSAGSSYAYVYCALGEFPAVIAAWCLSLEYGISGSAVARSWGDKVNAYMHSQLTTSSSSSGDGSDISNTTMYSWPLDDSKGFNLAAGLLQLAAVIVLLAGVDIGKFTVNFFTIVKMLLVLYMIVCGLMLFDSRNLSMGWAPMGYSGIVRGATSCFFGYIGYDEVCCMAAEAKDPHRTLPLAVFGTIAIVTVFYCLASLALVGMQDYTQINLQSGFSMAFKSRGWVWSQHIVAMGEIVTLPLVVLVSFLAQPRLMYAMADDGLIPRFFTETDGRGNLRKNIIASGMVCILIALFVPFLYLDDLISAGVLVSFNLTNCSLLMIRRSDPADATHTCSKLLMLYNALCVLFVFSFFYLTPPPPGSSTAMATFSTSSFYPIVFLLDVPLGLAIAACAWYLATRCPENLDPEGASQFRAIAVPYAPLAGILVNYLLLAQLSLWGLGLMVVYFALAAVFYFTYGIHHSIGNNSGWREVLRETNRYHSESDVQLHRSVGELEEDLGAGGGVGRDGRDGQGREEKIYLPSMAAAGTGSPQHYEPLGGNAGGKGGHLAMAEIQRKLS